MISATNRLRVLALTSVLSMAAGVARPPDAQAAQLDLSCSSAAAALGSSDERLQYNVVGQTTGTAAMLANLLCFVQDRRCSCLRNATESDSPVSTQFANQVGAMIADCRLADPNRSLSGISQQAALKVCS